MDIKKILATIGLGAAGVGATAANAATGGLLTPLTKTVLDALGARLDPDARAKLDAAAAELQGDLQKAEWDHAEKIAEIAAADVASARAREISVRDKIPAQLAWVMTIGLFSLLGILVFKPIPVANNDLLYVLLGSLATSQAAIITYYFGSSAGSAEKTSMLGRFRQEMGKITAETPNAEPGEKKTERT